MSDSRPELVVKWSADIEYEAVGAVDGVSKGVLVLEADGTPNFAIRRFVLGPGASVPKHTNGAEYEQYVLSGCYIVDIGDEEYGVEAGDSLLIPASVVRWYRNEPGVEGVFLRAVPDGSDAIEFVVDADA